MNARSLRVIVLATDPSLYFPSHIPGDISEALPCFVTQYPPASFSMHFITIWLICAIHPPPRYILAVKSGQRPFLNDDIG